MVISEKKVLLVELKTENSSRRIKQDKYLEKAFQANIQNLMEGLIQIFEATTSKVKYRRLMNEFEEIGWVKEENKKWKNTSQNKEIEIVYIQPEKDDNGDNKSVISFDEVAEIIEKNKTIISSRFAESLRKWKKNSNKK